MGAGSDRTKIPPGGREYGISPNPIRTEFLVKDRSDLAPLRYILPEIKGNYDHVRARHLFFQLRRPRVTRLETAVVKKDGVIAKDTTQMPGQPTCNRAGVCDTVIDEHCPWHAFLSLPTQALLLLRRRVVYRVTLGDRQTPPFGRGLL